MQRFILGGTFSALCVVGESKRGACNAYHIHMPAQLYSNLCVALLIGGGYVQGRLSS